MEYTTQLERREVVEMLLTKLGISTKKLGFLYLTAIITQGWMERETNPNPFQVYGNKIAKEANVFSGHIYANMQYAIEEAWFVGNFKLLDAIFGYSLMTLVTDAPTPNKFMYGIIVALLTLEERNMDIATFVQYMEGDGHLLKALSTFYEDNRD